MASLAPYYLVLKALHVIFMVTWFAGLFYLPRLFIYHVESEDRPSRERFEVMEKRLFGIMTIGAVLTTLFGLVLLGINHALIAAGWFQAKLLLLAGLFAYHYRSYLWMLRLRGSGLVADSKWLRWFNEIPVLFLFAIVIIAVTKAF